MNCGCQVVSQKKQEVLLRHQYFLESIFSSSKITLESRDDWMYSYLPGKEINETVATA